MVDSVIRTWMEGTAEWKQTVVSAQAFYGEVATLRVWEADLGNRMWMLPASWLLFFPSHLALPFCPPSTLLNHLLPS
jgi:hypothetical protein